MSRILHANPVDAASSAAQATTDVREHLQATLGVAHTIERELGGGAMSRVFLAEERALGRRVVVKVLSPDLAATVNIQRFKREIQFTAQLQHPNIVPILSAGETAGLPYYVMPFIEGDSLRVRLMRSGAMPIAIVVNILRDVAGALAFAHDKGVVHRDIKPENILLVGNRAIVADFGIGKALHASRVGPGPGAETLTDLGTAVGTPQYMAPEQASADPAVDHRADIYALGCVAYELVTGETPFVGRSLAALFRSIIVDAPAPIASKRADVPEFLCTLVARCLEKNPDDRPADAHEVIEGIETLVSAHSITTEGRGQSEVPTIAVLPFVNVSADPDNEHFADGLTDELIADLSMIKTLHVTSRQSAMRLKGSDKDPGTIARELGTRYVLTGGVRRAGSSLRISAQLVDTQNDVQLWGDKFNGTLDDVFDMQEQLSRQIVDALRLRLTPTEDRRLGEHPIADVRAYEYYLLARQQLWSYSTQSVERALQLVRQSQEIVGDNELLFVAEGWIYWQHVNFGMVPVMQYEECLQRAEASVAKAFALNSQSAKAHCLRGAIRSNRADPVEAIWEFKKALTLNPNDPDALLWLSYAYGVSGRAPLARALMQRLLQIDPLTSLNVSVGGMIELFDGCFDAALRWTQRSVDIDPANPSHRAVHAVVLAANGRREDAAALLDKVAGDIPLSTWAKLNTAMACAFRGQREDVLRIITPELRDAAMWDDIFAWWTADCLALVGEHEAAIGFVERAVEFGYIGYPFLSEYEPFLASLRNQPRFVRLMDQVRKAWVALEA